MRLTQGLHRAVQVRSRAPSTIFGERRRTWQQTRDRVARLAGGLVGLGLKRGDRVYVVSANSDIYLEVYYAVSWAGGVIVPANYRWAAAEHAVALADCGATFVLLEPSFGHLVSSIDPLGALTLVVMDAAPNHASSGATSTEALVEAGPSVDDACGEGDDLFGIFYTGGTTGRPKGVMLSHANVISNFLMTAATASYGSDPVFLHSAPMFHLADAAAMVGITIAAGAHVIIPQFDPGLAVKVIEREQVSIVVLVPTMFGLLRDHLPRGSKALSGVRTVRYGASPISESLLAEAMAMFPNAAFEQAYGQTELAPVATLLEARYHRPKDGRSYLRSAGRAIFGLDLRIVDPDMNEAPLGEVGEIAVRGPNVMKGYWNQPEQTARTIVGGWLRTGDGAYMDEEGFVYLVDRMKDMIVSGGENVYSAEVENALASHPDVAECAVIGVPDDKWGERVHAIVRLHGEARVLSEELIAHVRGLLAGYKCPRSIDIRAEPLPLSPVGKVMKTELRKPFWEGRDRQVA